MNIEGNNTSNKDEKMQLETGKNIADGANNRRPLRPGQHLNLPALPQPRQHQGQHRGLPSPPPAPQPGAQESRQRQRQQQQQQQDLVAMSHDLSKRRFFEKLERRESLKNPNLGTQIARPVSIGSSVIANDKAHDLALGLPLQLAGEVGGKENGKVDLIGTNTTTIGRQRHRFIEPFNANVANSSSSSSTNAATGELRGGDRREISSPIIEEEDRRSTCSSSGFGASVSVTSASETGSGCLIGKDTMTGATGPISFTIRDHGRLWHRESSSPDFLNATQKSITPNHCEYEPQCNDTMRLPRTQGYNTTDTMTIAMPTGQKKPTDEQSDYKRLPCSSGTYANGYSRASGGHLTPTTSAIATNMLVENQSYAIVERCPMPLCDVGIILEKDELIHPGYVNFPQGKTPVVEYATVRTSQANGRRGERQQQQQQRLHKPFHDSASEASFGERSSSSGSTANSAGFSALPPVKTECSPSNNFESLISLPIENSQQRKSSSLLKRFGSLVSRAVTSGTSVSNQQSAKLKLNTDEHNNHHQKKKAQQQNQQIDKRKANSDSNADAAAKSDSLAKSAPLASISDANCGNSKSALVFECKEQQPQQQQQSQRQPEESLRPGAQVPINREADLVILPSKCSVNTHQREQVGVEKKFQLEQSDSRIGQKSRRHHHQHRHHRNHYRYHNVRLSRDRKCSRYRLRRQADLSSSVTSISSTRSYSASSDSTGYRQSRHPFKSASLSEELESLVSRTIETDSLERGETGKEGENLPAKTLKSRSSTRLPRLPEFQPQRVISTSTRIDIDCVSPNGSKMKGEKSAKRQSSLLRIFNSASTSHETTAESSPNLTNSSHSRRSNKKHDDYEQQLEPISGFWSFSSLMEPDHATGSRVKPEKVGGRVKPSKNRGESKSTKELEKSLEVDHRQLIYSNLQSEATGCRMYSSLALPPENDNKTSGRYQSLNLCRGLVRNYVKHHQGHERNHNGCSDNYHHRHHHHHGHHRSHRNRRLSSRAHAQYSSSRCDHSDCCRSSSSENVSKSTEGGRDARKAHVWGQLIKISKTDGSQVVELHRVLGKSWGFFVARGAINNNKGIFISRMHDSLASSALSGLLSIGDRIMAIDECPIEPDYDILRVNQMISKKSKILLKVKPFKG